MIKSIELVDFLSHSDTKLELDNNTKYTICIIVENGGSGSNKAVKISNEIFNYISINFN